MTSVGVVYPENLGCGVGEFYGGELDGKPVLTISAFDDEDNVSITMTAECVVKLKVAIRYFERQLPCDMT